MPSRIRSTALAATLAPVAAATLLFSQGAMAQATSSVQLYGIVDAGVTRVSGLTAGNVTQLASGIMEGSRWGLRGTEDLGGGYRAIFTLENRFEVDTGSLSSRPISGTQFLPTRLQTPEALGVGASGTAVAPGVTLGNVVTNVNNGLASESLGVNVGSTGNRLFDRQAFVGLITPYGAVLAGRQYTPVFEIVANFDSMKTQSALGANQVASFPLSLDIRVSNAVQYRVQQGGFTANLMVGFGEADTATTNNVNEFYGFMAMYKGDSYSVGAGYNTRKNDVGLKSLTNVSLGGSLNVGPGTLGVLYVTNEDKNPSVNSIRTNSSLGGLASTLANAYARALQQDGKLFHIGYQVPFGASTVTFSVNSFNDGTAANADARSFGVAYTYALSKRTDLNAVVARVNNSANSQIALGGNGYQGGYTRAAGVDSTSVALGIRHRF